VGLEADIQRKLKRDCVQQLIAYANRCGLTSALLFLNVLELSIKYVHTKGGVQIDRMRKGGGGGLSVCGRP